MQIRCLPLLLTLSWSALAQTPSHPHDTPAQVVAPLPSDHPQRISGGVIAGNILTKVQPSIPEEARENHIMGTVVLHVIIGKDGHVKSAEAIYGPDILRQSYVEAVKQWTYKPYLLNGEAVEVDTTITISYQMNNELPTAASTSQKSVAPIELSTLLPNLVLPDDPSKPLRVSGGIIAGTLIKMTPPVFPRRRVVFM